MVYCVVLAFSKISKMLNTVMDERIAGVVLQPDESLSYLLIPEFNNFVASITTIENNLGNIILCI